MAFKLFIMFALGSYFLLFLTPCTRHVPPKPIPSNVEQQVHALKEFKDNFVIMPGQVSFLHFPYFGPFKFEKLLCNETHIPYFVAENQARAYVVQSYFVNDNFSCNFYFGENEIVHNVLSVGNFSINEFKYPKEFLNVDQKKVILSAKDQERANKEKQMMKKIYESSHKNLLFSSPFSAPLDSKITSIYGTKRIFNNKVETEHLGTDFRAKIGTEIFPANNGRVVFAGDLFFSGKTVVIDHGVGIFTIYCHLSKIIVNVTQLVTRETLLGLSGDTGRVSGPHLHWGVNIHGHWADGYSLIEESKKNFPELATK